MKTASITISFRFGDPEKEELSQDQAEHDRALCSIHSLLTYWPQIWASITGKTTPPPPPST